MGTTNTTTGSNTSQLQFNPLAQGVYNNLIGGAGQQLQGYINSPFSNPQYTLGAAQLQAGAKAAGQQNMNMLNQNQLAQGLGGQAGQGWLGAQRAQTGRANQAMSSQANIQNVLAALQRQQSAIGTGLSFSPQLTGQTGQFSQTSSMGGLGSWLPQLLGAGLSAGIGAANAGGGTSGLFANPTGGSVGGVSNPSLMSPSYMPSMAGVNPAQLQGMVPGGYGGSINPLAMSGMIPGIP